jgi:hypothetical protein
MTKSKPSVTPEPVDKKQHDETNRRCAEACMAYKKKEANEPAA